jgi:hypothetical protein
MKIRLLRRLDHACGAPSARGSGNRLLATNPMKNYTRADLRIAVLRVDHRPWGDGQGLRHEHGHREDRVHNGVGEILVACLVIGGSTGQRSLLISICACATLVRGRLKPALHGAHS